jgi:hypothetical protein
MEKLYYYSLMTLGGSVIAYMSCTATEFNQLKVNNSLFKYEIITKAQFDKPPFKVRS